MPGHVRDLEVRGGGASVGMYVLEFLLLSTLPNYVHVGNLRLQEPSMRLGVSLPRKIRFASQKKDTL